MIRMLPRCNHQVMDDNLSERAPIGSGAVLTRGVSRLATVRTRHPKGLLTAEARLIQVFATFSASSRPSPLSELHHDEVYCTRPKAVRRYILKARRVMSVFLQGGK